MVLLRRIELAGRDDLGHDGACEALGPLQLPLGLFRQPPLRLIVVKDGRAILLTVVAELRVCRERVDVVPEHVEQLGVADLPGVIDHLHRLGVSRAACRDLLVPRALRVASGVAHRGGQHAVESFERWLHAPEAAARERRDGGLARRGSSLTIRRRRPQQDDHCRSGEQQPRHGLIRGENHAHLRLISDLPRRFDWDAAQFTRFPRVVQARPLFDAPAVSFGSAVCLKIWIQVSNRVS